MDQVTKYFRLLPVEVASNSQVNFPLSEDQTLANATKILSVEAYPVGTLAIDPDEGKPVVNDTVFNKATLTLISRGDDNRINNIPLRRLNPALNNGQPFLLDIPALSLTKCFIHIGNSAGLVAGEKFVLGFRYEK